MTLKLRKEFTDDLAKLREAIAVSRELLISSKSLVAESKKVRENSWIVIEESYVVLNKSKFCNISSTARSHEDGIAHRQAERGT
jgi:hypothetical protein